MVLHLKNVTKFRQVNFKLRENISEFNHYQLVSQVRESQFNYKLNSPLKIKIYNNKSRLREYL